MALTSYATAFVVACVLLALAASTMRAGSHSPTPVLVVNCVSKAASLIDCVHQGSTKCWLAVVC